MLLFPLTFNGAPLHNTAGALVLVAVAVVLLVHLAQGIQSFVRINRGLKPIPNAPGGNWVLGHVLPLLFAPARQLGAWDVMGQWSKQLGPIYRFRVMQTQGVVIADPLGLKRVFQTRFKLYKKDIKMAYNPFMPVLGTGLVTSDGDLWQKQRNLIGPALRVEILDDIISISKRAVDRLSAKLEAHRGAAAAVNLEEEFRLLTLQVIGEAILSLPHEECDRVFPKLYLPIMEEGYKRVFLPYRKYLPTPSWFRFKRRMGALNDFLIGLARERWQSRLRGKRPERGDILDQILASIEATGTKWSAALETQLCYELKTFLLAGHETSASMLTWSLYELTQNKEHMDKVRSEAQAVFGADESEPSRRAVDGMTWTLAVLKETLRKYNVVPVVARIASEDDEILGHRIPAGTMVTLHLQAVHKLYKDPEVYRPQRFMPGGEFDNFDDAIRPYMFVPFIQGPRNCLGQHFALLEARVVLSLLVKRFKFTRVAKHEPRRHPKAIPISPLEGMDLYIE